MAYNALGGDEVSSVEEIQQFLSTEDLTKPLSFAKTPQFTKYLQCGAWLSAFASQGLTCFCPIPLFKPAEVTKHYALKLDQDSVVFNSAFNDFCCHIAVSEQTLPLDKIQDVQLVSGCCQTLFGLKEVRLQTAGVNQAGTPDVSTAFLENPELVREAIQLAVKLSKRRGGSPAQQQQPMHRGPAGGSSMTERLQRLSQLVASGVLTGPDADRIRVKVLVAEQDFTLRLADAEKLLEKGVLSQKEFEELRVALLAQIEKTA